MAPDDATGWFEPLYAEAAAGRGGVPWDHGASPQIASWLRTRPGSGAPAVVVGCGLGDDADLVARAGWRTTSFDISPTAACLARERFPDSAADFVVADLLDLPADWRGGFDLVVERFTVQALPVRLRGEATAAVGSLVAEGGTLLVQVHGTDDASPDRPGPPWRLTRAELDGFATGGLVATRVESVEENGTWLAELTRPS